MTYKNLAFFFFFFLIGIVLYVLYRIFQPFLGVFFWTAIIAFAFYPLYRRIRPFFRQHHNVAAAVMTSGILMILVPLLGVTTFRLIEETVLFSQRMAAFFQSDAFQAYVQDLLSRDWVQKLEFEVFRWRELIPQVQEWAVTGMARLGTFAAGIAAELAKNVILGSFKFFLMVFILFFFIRDGEKIAGFIYDIMPLPEPNKKELFKKTRETFESLIHGQLIIALVKAVLLGISFWFLKLPFPLLLSVVTFFFSLVPILGAHFIWIPFAIVLALQQDYVRAVTLALFGTLIIAPSDNILLPFLVGKKTRLPYLLLFFGVMGGVLAYGIAGIFIGPAVISIFFVLINIYRERFQVRSHDMNL